MGKASRPEQALHRAAAQYLDAVLLESAVWFHCPNGGARNRTEAAILSGLGVKPGIPDLLILYRGQLIGIELKAQTGRLVPPLKPSARIGWR